MRFGGWCYLAFLVAFAVLGLYKAGEHYFGTRTPKFSRSSYIAETELETAAPPTETAGAMSKTEAGFLRKPLLWSAVRALDPVVLKAADLEGEKVELDVELFYRSGLEHWEGVYADLHRQFYLRTVEPEPSTVPNLVSLRNNIDGRILHALQAIAHLKCLHSRKGHAKRALARERKRQEARMIIQL